jgi:hypothetical protein
MVCQQQVRHCAHVPGSGERVAWRAWCTGRVDCAYLLSLLQHHAVVRALASSWQLLFRWVVPLCPNSKTLRRVCCALVCGVAACGRVQIVLVIPHSTESAAFAPHIVLACAVIAIVVVCDLICHICCCVCCIMYATFTLLLPAGAAGLIGMVLLCTHGGAAGCMHKQCKSGVSTLCE